MNIAHSPVQSLSLSTRIPVFSLMRSLWFCCLSLLAFRVSAEVLEYDVFYKDTLSGTQSITLTPSNSTIQVEDQMSLNIKVLFVTVYRYSETCRASFSNGLPLRYEYQISDNGKTSLVVGVQSGDSLKVWKDRKETTIPLDDTRIHSWSLHLDRSLSLVPLPGSVRGPTNMFLLEEGGGISLSIENAGTVNIAAVDKTWSATHVIWHKGKYQDQVWYASALGNLPVRYEHENANGRTLFVLKSIH